MSHLYVLNWYLRFKNARKLFKVGCDERSSTPRYYLPPRKICLYVVPSIFKNFLIEIDQTQKNR